jgi:hypothetical protein
MKTIRSMLILFMLSLLFQSCVINFPDSISGNGNIIKQSREVTEFTGIKVSAGIDVLLTQGQTVSVDVEADENLQEWIRTEVKGSVLHIYSEKNIRMAKSKKVFVTCNTLDRIEISSAGDINSVNKFNVDKLSIEMSSAGDLHFEVEANEINISISSAGNAYMKGKTNVLKADLSSAGDLNAFDLEARTGDISVSSAGSARVFVTEEASFYSSSAGHINYKGEPKIKSIHTSSAGSVNKK